MCNLWTISCFIYLNLLMCVLFTRGPVNEDVFVTPVGSSVREMKTMDPDIQDITEQIHRLLLQVREKIRRCRNHNIDHRRSLFKPAAIKYIKKQMLIWTSEGLEQHLSSKCSLFISEQPVHNSGSSGYNSLNRNVGMSSSSESLNNGSGNKIQLEEEEEEVSGKARPVSKTKYCSRVWHSVFQPVWSCLYRMIWQ